MKATSFLNSHFFQGHGWAGKVNIEASVDAKSYRVKLTGFLLGLLPPANHLQKDERDLISGTRLYLPPIQDSIWFLDHLWHKSGVKSAIFSFWFHYYPTSDSRLILIGGSGEDELLCACMQASLMFIFSSSCPLLSLLHLVNPGFEFHVFIGNCVPLIVGHDAFLSQHTCRGVALAGHGVPSDTAVGSMVQTRPGSSQHIWLLNSH